VCGSVPLDVNRIRAILILAVLGLTAGCGSSGGTEMPPAELPLRLDTTGGVAGIRTTLVVDGTGAWTLTDHKDGGSTSTGQLTDDQLAELRRLLADPQLVNVSVDGDPACPDIFHYKLEAQHRTVRNGPCGEASPAFESLISYLHEVTSSEEEA
jgi:hypothetical protein